MIVLKPGDIYTGPGGNYRVHRAGVLASVERPSSYVIVDVTHNLDAYTKESEHGRSDERNSATVPGGDVRDVRDVPMDPARRDRDLGRGKPQLSFLDAAVAGDDTWLTTKKAWPTGGMSSSSATPSDRTTDTNDIRTSSESTKADESIEPTPPTPGGPDNAKSLASHERTPDEQPSKPTETPLPSEPSPKRKRASAPKKSKPSSDTLIPTISPLPSGPECASDPKVSVVAGWLADLTEKWSTWSAACVSPLFLGATRPGSSALPGAPQWMGCVRPIKSLLDMLRTPNEGAVMPHVYFIAPRGSTPVCERCRAGGRRIRLSPIGYADEIAPEEAPPVITDDLLPMLRFPPVGRLPIVTGIKPPSHVVIYANYDITPDEAAEIAAIEEAEAMDAIMAQDLSG